MKLILFGAAWCPSCASYKPRVEALVDSLPGVEFKYVDVDSDFQLTGVFRIRVLPSLGFWEYGAPQLLPGTSTNEEILAFIDSVVVKDADS